MARGQEASTSTSTSAGGKRARLRHRIPKSCLPCLSGKRACDRKKPVCSRCARVQHECTYTQEPLPVPRMARRSSIMAAAEGEESRASIENDDEEEDDDDDENEYVDERELKRTRSAPVLEQPFGRHAVTAAAANTAFMPSPTSQHIMRDHKHDPWTDSDVHSAGQALVHLQGSTPWSISTPNTIASTTDATPPSMDRPYGSSSSAGNAYLHNPVSSGAAKASSLRSASSTATPGRLRDDDGAGSHVNLNGQPLWHGDTVTGTSVFNQVATSSSGGVAAALNAVSANMGGGGGSGMGASTIAVGGVGASGNVGTGPSTRTGGDRAGGAEQDGDTASEEQSSINVTSGEMPHNIQNAFNGLLYPMADSFPFETIWSSGSNFKQEVLPLFPAAKDGKAIIDAFKRFLRVASPGLLDSNIVGPAETFLCLRSEREREMISLPWMASFFMMVAIGLESQRACGPSDDEHSGSDSDDGDARPATTDGQSSRKGSRHPDTRRHCDLLLSATYQALRLCSFLGSPNLQTIYSQLLIGIYLLHTERASNAWPILGSITRQAQSIGLHVEPSTVRGGGVRASVEERELRRRLWWTIVQQDVLLSSIFGRPLAVSRFTCRITSVPTATAEGVTSLDKIERSSTYQEILCQFSVFARRQLNDDYEQEWSEGQVRQYKDELLSWYHNLPSHMIMVTGGGAEEAAAAGDAQGTFIAPSQGIAEKRHLRDQLSRRNTTTIQHAVDLDLQVQFALLTLFRNRLITAVPVDGATTKQGDEAAAQHHLNERSLAECGRYVHRITLTLSTLVDLLGTLQAGMVWVRVFYAFHAGVTAAYLALSRPTTWLGARARDDLTTLTDVCQRLPDRFDGLQTVKATFGVLSRLVQVHPDQHPHRRAAAAAAAAAAKGGRTSTPGAAAHRRDDDAAAVARLSTSSSSDANNLFASPTQRTPSSSNYFAMPRGRQSSVAYVAQSTHDQDAADAGYSPLRLDELLSSNNIGLPAFNISRDPPVSGLAPFFDQSYVPGASTPGVTAHSGGGSDMNALMQQADGGMFVGTPHGFSNGGGGGAHVQFSALPPSTSTANGNGVGGAGQTHVAGIATPPQPPSRPDRGFPEPFGPMIAPPGPDASTNEIVSFWRDFFALPFEASDMGLA